MSSGQRTKVLSLYKQILRLGKNWTSKEGSAADTENERNYVINEARRLFRQNSSVSKTYDWQHVL